MSLARKRDPQHLGVEVFIFCLQSPPNPLYFEYTFILLELTDMTNKTIYLKDYQVPNYNVENITLDFDIYDGYTKVLSTATYYKNLASEADNTLVLFGRDLELTSLLLDSVEYSNYEISGEEMTLSNMPDKFTLTVHTKIYPETNKSLEGLYQSGDILCTQCEAQGFRRMTYYLDRPDVMTKFQTRISADKTRYPVLLSNGNLLEQWDLDDNRHFVVWEDPFKKPAYLFAVVAGNIEHISDSFTTMSGKDIELKIFATQDNIHKCDFAMGALKRAMKWDEERFGREYDLDLFMIVGVDDFNSGAMENKGLNIFNSAVIFATPETATDRDYIYIERVIGHEYFHNWSGNRVTCRDWFQLSLKEGFTVYRDSEFTSDMHNRDLKRIDDVNLIRNHQFTEDASPMAHPIRPDSFQEIRNFYTMTVYEKGSEVVRLYETLLGTEAFRKGSDLYFKRHDGQAVTTEDFLKAMQDANDEDLSQMQRWYEQAGTPVVHATDNYDAETQTYTLTLSQSTPATAECEHKNPFLIPVKFGLLDTQGNDIDIDTHTLVLSEETQEFVFEWVSEKPLPSLLREFSAPVKLEYDYTLEDYLFLMKHDSDSFNRFEAGQKFALCVLVSLIQTNEHSDVVSLLEAFEYILHDPDLEIGMKAHMLILPSHSEIATEIWNDISHEMIHNVREDLQKQIAEHFISDFKALYSQLSWDTQEYRIIGADIEKRSLKNLALHYLSYIDSGKIAYAQYQKSKNMTDISAALKILVHLEKPQADKALQQFITKWSGDTNVVDKWFSIQAMSPYMTAQGIEELTQHPLFDIKNPNKLRSVFSVFATYNHLNFHAQDGSGYKIVADSVIEVSTFNSQIAGRLVKSMIGWRNLESSWSKLLKNELVRISEFPNLASDVSEIVEKSL